MSWPKLSITHQILLLLISALVIAQALNVSLLFGDRQLTGRSYTADVSIAHIVKSLKSLPEFELSDLPLDLPRSPDQRGPTFISVRERAVRSHSIEPLKWAEDRLRTALKDAGIEFVSASAGLRQLNNVPPPNRKSPQNSSFRAPSKPADPRGMQFADMEDMVMSVQVQPGIFVNRMVPYYPVEQVLKKVALTILLTTALVGLVAILITRRITRPVKILSNAADRFGRGETLDPIKPHGPPEIRNAIEAFNGMQDRLRRLIETLRFSLRSLSHDLRSPLTSLQFRTKALEDTAEREKMIASLKEMRDIVEEILMMSRDASSLEPVEQIELCALSESVVSNYADFGSDVRLTCPDAPVVAPCRRLSIHRALDNLIGNALRYGATVSVSVRHHDNQALLIVEDNGPGMSEDRLRQLQQPGSVAAAASSNIHKDGGFGLGLSIVKAIMEGHGGSLDLEQQEQGGLRAILTLPK